MDSTPEWTCTQLEYEQMERALRRKAAALGYELVPRSPTTAAVQATTLG